MKKKVIILIVIAFIVSSCNQTTKKQTEEVSFNNIDSLTLDIENSDNNEQDTKSLLFEETKNIMLNNKNHVITFKYYLNNFADSETKQTSLNVYFDTKEIYEINSCHIGLISFNPAYDNINENDSFRNKIYFNIKSTESEIINLIKRTNPYGIKDNFTIIKDGDGIEYLIFAIEDTGDNMPAISNTFINNNGEILHNEWNNLCIFDEFKEKITDNNYLSQPFHITANKYYKLEMECPFEHEEDKELVCKIYEKIITINRNKIIEEKIEISTITPNENFCQ